jgi:hypothetical protein
MVTQYFPQILKRKRPLLKIFKPCTARRTAADHRRVLEQIFKRDYGPRPNN